MRKATKTVAMWFGITAGLAALEHGYFEILQGNVRPPGLMFPSWGEAVCDPVRMWHACEPAMSILPSFLLSGILTIFLSLGLMVWTVWFIQRRHAGWVQMALAVLLLLFGGGFFPPIIAFVGGLAGIADQPSLELESRAVSSVSQPGCGPGRWSFSWSGPSVSSSFGYFFNDLLKSIMVFGVLVILGSLVLSVYSAYAHDAVSQA